MPHEDKGILKSDQKKIFPATSLKEVVSYLQYEGPPKTLKDMEEAIRQGVEEKSSRDGRE
ncbi:MAG: hypothetical protein D3910_00815 [Candidatus Electrothrix sp. ATG2]|nr:hypothetical protein [Candidatus Electrothrix sp. ATG2]